MKLQLRVDIVGSYWSGGAIIEIPELLRQTFEPLITCDEPMISYIGGGILEDSAETRTVLKVRKDAAKILAEELTKQILLEMGKLDTHNGYYKEAEK